MLHIYFIAVCISAFIMFLGALECMVYINKHYIRIGQKPIGIEAILAIVRLIIAIMLLIPSIAILFGILFAREAFFDAVDDALDENEFAPKY